MRPCFENECSASDVTTILVRDGFYEFQRPACVELFFRSGEAKHMRNKTHRVGDVGNTEEELGQLEVVMGS